jgi:hypothetical protein
MNNDYIDETESHNIAYQLGVRAFDVYTRTVKDKKPKLNRVSGFNNIINAINYVIEKNQSQSDISPEIQAFEVYWDKKINKWVEWVELEKTTEYLLELMLIKALPPKQKVVSIPFSHTYNFIDKNTLVLKIPDEKEINKKFTQAFDEDDFSVFEQPVFSYRDIELNRFCFSNGEKEIEIFAHYDKQTETLFLCEADKEKTQ